MAQDLRVDTHDAVKWLFGKELVKTAVIEDEFALILRRHQDDRLLADYDVTYAPAAAAVRYALRQREQISEHQWPHKTERS